MNKINDILDSLQGRQPKIKDSWDLTESILKKVEEQQAAGLSDNILASRSSQETPNSSFPAGTHKRKASLWRWAAAAAIIIAAGLGATIYQSQTSQQKDESGSLTSETNQSHLRDTTVSPMRQADTAARIAQDDLTQEPSRPVKSVRTTACPTTTFSKKKMAASENNGQPGRKPRNNEDLKPGQSTMPAEPVAEEQLMALSSVPQDVTENDPRFDAYAHIEKEMREIHSRGEKVEALVAEITKP